jgi:hypothetical protein
MPDTLKEPDRKAEACAAVVVDAALEVHRNLGPAFGASCSPADQPTNLGVFAAWRLSH